MTSIPINVARQSFRLTSTQAQWCNIPSIPATGPAGADGDRNPHTESRGTVDTVRTIDRAVYTRAANDNGLGETKPCLCAKSDESRINEEVKTKLPPDNVTRRPYGSFIARPWLSIIWNVSCSVLRARVHLFECRLCVWVCVDSTALLTTVNNQLGCEKLFADTSVPRILLNLPSWIFLVCCALFLSGRLWKSFPVVFRSKADKSSLDSQQISLVFDFLIKQLGRLFAQQWWCIASRTSIVQNAHSCVVKVTITIHSKSIDRESLLHLSPTQPVDH